MLAGVLALAGAVAFTAPTARPAMVQHARVSTAPTMQFFGGGGGGGAKAEKLPPGWKRVKSDSRPGEFSYLNTKNGQKYNKIPQGAFYDDEMDTTAKSMWRFDSQEKQAAKYRSDVEAAGMNNGNGDLATVGGSLYVAFVPFLLFFIAYIFGGIGSPYSANGGNF